MAGMAFLTVLLLALMELNKNTLAGWILVPAAFVLYLFARKKALRGKKHRRLVMNLAYLGVLAACFAVSQPPVRRVPVSDAAKPESTEVLSVAQGSLTGVRSADGSVEIFAGIPYAAPPVGDLRWKEPQEPAAWEGVRSCDKFAPMSMQPSNGNIYNSLAQIIGYHDYKISLKDNFTPPDERGLPLSQYLAPGGYKQHPKAPRHGLHSRRFAQDRPALV